MVEMTGLLKTAFYESIKIDKLVKSQKVSVFVIPAKAGIQENQSLLDSRLRGSDGLGDFLRDHQDCLTLLNNICGRFKKGKKRYADSNKNSD